MLVVVKVPEGSDTSPAEEPFAPSGTAPYQAPAPASLTS